MADQDKIDTRFNYFWIHNVFGHFIKDTMDYFAEYLYPRFSPWKVIGTFDKAVEYINKQTEHGRELDQPLRPGLVLDPSGDFAFDETYGKQPWRYPNLMPGFAKYIFEPIYQDQQVLITVAFGRIVGELNFLALMSSFYEYTDMKVFLNLIFGGMDRFIYPRYFNSFIVLPSEIYDYEYENDVTGLKYKLDLERAYSQLIRTTATEEVVFPCVIKPRYKMTNMSDSSTRLGGTDNLPDWRLSFTLQYEIEVPTYIILESDYFANKLNVSVNYLSCYTSNEVYTGAKVPSHIDTIDSTLNTPIDATSNTVFHEWPIEMPTEASIQKKYKEEKIRYYHIITQQEADSTSYIDISLPHPVNDYKLLLLNARAGTLTYHDHYTLIDGLIIRINKEYVSLVKDEVLEVYVYGYT